MQAQLDKNILALSGGAIAVSFVFLEKAKAALGINVLKVPDILLGAWVAWGLSIAFILVSYYSSSIALARTAEFVDDRTIFMRWSESIWNRCTKFLNPAGGLAFLVGMALLVLFVAINIHRP